MFTDLAVIDWIALALAAVILAAACAAAVVAYATSSRGRRVRPETSDESDSTPEESESSQDPETSPSGSTTTSAHRWSKPEHAKQPVPARLEPPPVPSIALLETAADADEATEIERKLADRAARLRRRPVPEPAPQPERSVLEHTPMVRSVMARSTPAHAATSGRSPDGQDLLRSNYDTVEGFKARTPGFFDDPMGRHELRYWDGHTWTEYVKERGERFTDPL